MTRTAALLVLGSCLVFAQTAPAPTATPSALSGATFYGAGVSYNPGASPSIAGTALAAQQVTSIGSKPTFAFAVLDVLPASVKPFIVTTNLSAGVAQQVFTIGTTTFYIPLSTGFTYTGTNSGWNWSTGLMVLHPLKGSFSIGPNVRTVKSSVNGNSGYQLVFGTLITFGK